MLCLGLDHGHSGAGLLTDGTTLVAAMRWRQYTRNKVKQYALTCATASGPPHTMRGLTNAYAIGVALQLWLAPRVALHGGQILIGCEAAYVGRNARTALGLSRWSGAMVGPLQQWAEPEWYKPGEWRTLSLRPKWWTMQAAAQGKLASMARANKRAALAWQAHRELNPTDEPWPRKDIDAWMKSKAKALFLPKRIAAKLEAEQQMPVHMPGLVELAAKVDGGEHVFDAAGINRCRWLKRRGGAHPHGRAGPDH